MRTQPPAHALRELAAPVRLSMPRLLRIVILATTMVVACSGFTCPSAHAAWGVDGTVVCDTANVQSGAVAVSDGAGGALVAWNDARFGATGRIYVQRLSPTGLPLWATNGVILSNVGRNTKDVAIASDGSGGAIVTWAQVDAGDFGFDIVAQRVLPTGALAWGVNPVTICGQPGGLSNAKHQITPTICPDGAGGAFIAWDDARLGNSLHDIYAQHVNASGVVQWTADGVAVCANGLVQTNPVISSGATGTAVVMWIDQRNANPDIFAQRVNDPAGGVSWTADGVAVCNTAGSQSDLRTLADGSGAYAVWSDLTLLNAFMQRLDAATGAGLYAANGQIISSVGAGYKLRPSIVASGSGTLIAWQDHRNTFDDIYAQRFDSNGNELWTSGGVRLTDLSTHQEYTLVAADGAGGAFVACRDLRSGGSTIGMVGHVDNGGALAWPINGTFTSGLTPTTLRGLVADGAGGAVFVWDGASGVFAQRVVASSNLADYDAVVSAVSDLPGDEGGFVRIATSAAIGDYVPGTPPITGYNVWRQIAPSPQPEPNVRTTADVDGARSRGRAAIEAGTRGERARIDPLAAETVGFPSGTWESLGFNAALGHPSYTLAVATPSDSTSLSNADRTYVLTVHTSTPSIYAVSNTAVGHSVDNLPPSAPQNVAGQKTGPTTVMLNWSASPEGDLAHYDVYRGASAGFTPAPGNRIGTPAAATFTDNGFAASYYKVSALDRHGNESAFSLLAPETIVGVGEPGVPSVSFLGEPAPNPFRSGTTFSLGLSRTGYASVRVFDTGGRLVRTLAAGERAAGVHPIVWDGRDAHGRPAPAGVYLVRGDFGGARWTRRVLLTR
jgi:hypothetical protein